MTQSVSCSRYEAAGRDAITPFVCSTFKDFAKERDYLADVVFRRLQEHCKGRGTQFLPVDLRWNEESFYTNHLNVLRQCLDAIKECSPFFICLLGERYGIHRPPDAVSNSDETFQATVEWLDKNFETAASAGNEWVLDKENRHCSLTELEIIKASFRERTDHGYFYFRDPTHLQEQSADQNVSQRAMLMETYESESEFAARKIMDLKQQIIDTDLPVKHFKTVEELGQLVLKDWLQVVDSLYPPIEKKIFTSVWDAAFREWSEHESFAKTRRTVFVETDFVRMTLDTLTRHAQYPSRGLSGRESSTSLTRINEGTYLTSVLDLGMESFPSIVAIVGGRGCGASAILSNWVKTFTRDHSQMTVISHYAESGQRSAEITSFMRRCTSELRSVYRGRNPIIQLDFLDLIDFDTITEAFQGSLSLGPCVIVLDGLCHMTASQNIPAHVIKELSWLPSNIPPSCRVVLSTSISDISYKFLCTRDDVHLVDIPSLHAKDKLRVLHEYLGDHARYLDPRDEETIVAGKLSGHPVYHAVLANQIRLHGRPGIAESHLETYTRARSLSDFWTAVIHTWSQDYSWLKPSSVKNGVPVQTHVSKDRLNNGWIPDTLRLIAVSREGMTSTELKKILHAFGYAKNHAISPAAWAQFISATKCAMYIRNDGLLTFQQASLREAVDVLLLNSLTAPSRVRLVTKFESPWELQKFQFHSVLTKGLSKFPCDARLVNELPWQFKVAGDVSGLKAILARSDVFVKMWSNLNDLRYVVDFLNYCKTLSQEGYDMVDTYCNMVEELEGASKRHGNEQVISHYTLDIDNNTLFDTHGIAEAIFCKKRGSKYTSIEVAYVAYLVGIYFLGLQKFESAKLMLQRALKLSRDVASINNVDFLCQVYKSLGDLYYTWGLRGKAVEYYEGVLKTASDVSRYVNINEMELLAIQAHARYRLAAISIRKTLDFSGFSNGTTSDVESSGKQKDNSLVLVPQTGEQLNEASRLMDISKLEEKGPLYQTMALLAVCDERLDEAELLLNKAIYMVEKWYGPSHPAVATILQDMARYQFYRGSEKRDVSQIEKLYRRVLNIREKKLGKSHLDVAETLLELGCILRKKGTRDSMKDCRDLLQRSVDIRTEKLGMYHEQTIQVRKTLLQVE